VTGEPFGLAGEPRPLPGELDRNYALEGHVLKLHRAETDPAWLDLQDAAMAHVAGRTGEVATPRLRPALDGAARVATDEGIARVLTWIPGTPWASLPEHDAGALAGLGRAVARVDAALADFDHPALDRPLAWNMLAAADLLDDARAAAAASSAAGPAGAGAAAAAAAILARFAARVGPALRALPAQAIHNDANEHNVLVGADGRVSGLIDFGDLCRAPRIAGLAVAAAYAMTLLSVPERQVLPLVAGYHAVAPLTEAELALLPDLIRTRLAMSVAMAARQRREQPGNDYLLISQDGVTALLERLGADPAELELLRLRAACGYEPVPTAAAVRAHLEATESGPVCAAPLADAPIIDFSGPSPDAPDIEPSLGRYLEDRRVYDSDAFIAELPGERRTLHLGVDIFLPAGTPILAPLDGVVRDVAFRPAARDWGGIVVLDHTTPDGIRFHTLYGHLSRASVARLAPGDPIARGATVAELGDESENGGWAPHLHFQVMTTDLGRGCDAHGVGTLAEYDVWASQSPDPNLILGIPGGVAKDQRP
jgi:Ser/Thr protein kinase RdoA (MazF antagonist)